MTPQIAKWACELCEFKPHKGFAMNPQRMGNR